MTQLLDFGDCPHWNPTTQSVYFVDVCRGTINRYHPETDEFYSATIRTHRRSPGTSPTRISESDFTVVVVVVLFLPVLCHSAEGYDRLSFVVPVEVANDTYAVGLGFGIGVFSWDGQSADAILPDYYVPIIQDMGEVLFVGKADASGRLFVGECARHECTAVLYDSFRARLTDDFKTAVLHTFNLILGCDSSDFQYLPHINNSFIPT